jgi:hypothetical protein
MTGTASCENNEKRVRGAMSGIVAPRPSQSSATSRPASLATSDHLTTGGQVVRLRVHGPADDLHPRSIGRSGGGDLSDRARFAHESNHRACVKDDGGVPLEPPTFRPTSSAHAAECLISRRPTISAYRQLARPPDFNRPSLHRTEGGSPPQPCQWGVPANRVRAGTIRSSKLDVQVIGSADRGVAALLPPPSSARRSWRMVR